MSRRWFSRATLAFPGFETPLLPIWSYSGGSRSTCSIRLATPEPMQILFRAECGPGFRWIAHRGGPRTQATVNGAALTRHELEDGDVLKVGIAEALGFPGTAVSFHERLQPELDAGWNAIAEDPDDETRWRVQIDALLAAGDPLGPAMLAQGAQPENSRHFGFQRSVRVLAGLPMLLERLEGQLADPLAVFVTSVTLDCRKQLQPVVEDTVAAVVKALVKNPRAVRRLNVSVAAGMKPAIPTAPGLEVRVASA